MIPLIDINHYDFDFPENLIAEYPTPNRGQSKLLQYNKGVISDNLFAQLPLLLPPNSLLVLNQTKVIPARLFFQKESGAKIEIFLVKPQSQDQTIWQCIIGNRAKFKTNDTLYNQSNPKFKAVWHSPELNQIKFYPTADNVITDIFNYGHIPLPPYIKRKPQSSDEETYQTVFANEPGAVAAPTASLHFTNETIDQIKKAGHKLVYCTLHVGLGTFAPVKSKYIHEHVMHEEDFNISYNDIQTILNHTGPIIPIGTTAMRLIESLGVLAFQHQNLSINSTLAQTDSAYHTSYQTFTIHQIQKYWKQFVSVNAEMFFHGRSQILIAPGYPLKITSGLITNFHQPKSTLLLLIATLVGNNWKKIYQHAIQNQYRLFSYGDSSILLP